MTEGYFVFKEDKENGIPEIKVNRQLVTKEELFLFQAVGYYGTGLLVGFLRLDKIVECCNEDKLWENSRCKYIKDFKGLQLL